MLRSQTLQLRQSEIRSRLAEIQSGDDIDDEQRSQLDELSVEYRRNETELRAALITEEAERQANAPEDTEARERRNLIGQFEIRQVVGALSEHGGRLTGATGELVEEYRSQGNFEGVPIPYEALVPEIETRADTVSSGTPDPVSTMPIIDRIFAGSVASQFGIRSINIPFGSREWPIATSGATFGHAATEGADLPAATVFATNDVVLNPDQTAGARIDVTRVAMKQSGPGLEAAIRRDMRKVIAEGLDNVLFQGDGTGGVVTGILNVGGITETDISAAADYGVFLTEATAFMVANAISNPNQVRILMRPEIFEGMDNNLITGTATSEWDRLVRRFRAPILSSNALAAPAGDPAESDALLSVNVDGVAPAWLGLYGAIDVVRDVYTKAASGTVSLTALLTYDLAVSRAIQVRKLTGLQ